MEKIEKSFDRLSSTFVEYVRHVHLISEVHAWASADTRVAHFPWIGTKNLRFFTHHTSSCVADSSRTGRCFYYFWATRRRPPSPGARVTRNWAAEAWAAICGWLDFIVNVWRFFLKTRLKFERVDRYLVVEMFAVDLWWIRSVCRDCRKVWKQRETMSIVKVIRW